MKNNSSAMLLFVVLTSMIMFAACKPQPEFYVDGKPCYTRKNCVKSHSELRWVYQPVMNTNGQMEGHYVWQNETICDSSIIDTIEIK